MRSLTNGLAKRIYIFVYILKFLDFNFSFVQLKSWNAICCLEVQEVVSWQQHAVAIEVFAIITERSTTTILCAQNVNVIWAPSSGNKVSTWTTITTTAAGSKCCTFENCAASEVFAAKNRHREPLERDKGCYCWCSCFLCAWINVKTQSRAINSEQSAGEKGVKIKKQNVKKTRSKNEKEITQSEQCEWEQWPSPRRWRLSLIGIIKCHKEKEHWIWPVKLCGKCDRGSWSGSFRRRQVKVLADWFQVRSGQGDWLKVLQGLKASSMVAIDKLCTWNQRVACDRAALKRYRNAIKKREGKLIKFLWIRQWVGHIIDELTLELI